ncbi:acyloxyacyl hydrolase [Lishizhenia tianjinensis]|nr:acyloxyacyl hydrolase [Lishizhenia tianjinensis]
MKNFYILCMLMLLSFTGIAQKKNYALSIHGAGGFLLAHRSVMAHLPQQHTGALNFRLSFLGKDGKYWQQLMNQPTYGLDVHFTSLGNKNLLGKGIAGLYFVDVPLSKSLFYPSVYGGAGLAWVEKIYDVQHNPKNNAIGSHLNLAVRLGLNMNYEWEQTHLHFGFHVMHFSNGASKMPNLGVNLPYVQLGVSQFIGDAETEEYATFKALRKDVTHWRILGVYSRKDVYPLLQKVSSVYSLSAIRTKYKSKYWSYDLGVEFIANQAQAKMFPNRVIKQGELLQVGLYTAYVLSFDRLDLFAGLGGYVKNDLNIAGWLYQKVGARYHFNDKWAVQFAIKANFGKADYLEYGINYTFHEK